MNEIRKRVKQLLYGNARVFDDVYRTHAWGIDKTKTDKFSSGSGSDPANNVMYEDIIVDLIDSRRLDSVLDIGCGDFRVSGSIIKRLSRNVNWTAIDVSKVIIERNKRLHSCKNVEFIHMHALVLPKLAVARRTLSPGSDDLQLALHGVRWQVVLSSHI